MRAAVARWRLGSDDYLQSVDNMRPPPVSGITEIDGAPVPTSAFDNSRELAKAVELSLLRTNEILKMPIASGDGVDEGVQNARARVLLAAARTTLMTQLRADDNVLRRTAQTGHTKMLRDLKTLRDQMAGGPIVDAAE